jgi:hypothetical protein
MLGVVPLDHPHSPCAAGRADYRLAHPQEPRAQLALASASVSRLIPAKRAASSSLSP